MAACSNALGEHGVFVVQIGESASDRDYPLDFGKERRLLQFRYHLMNSGFGTILDVRWDKCSQYSEAHCDFGYPWSYQLGMKSPDSVARFFLSEAEVNLAVSKRIRRTINGEHSLRYFDGATMVSYQQPNRATENVWCMTEGAKCKGKHGFDADIPDVSLASGFRLDDSEDNGKFSLVVDKELPERSYLGLDESTTSVLVPPAAYNFLKNVALPGCTFGHIGWESSVWVR
jgi:hypothetical protein